MKRIHLTSTLTTGANQAIETIDARLTHLTTSLTGGATQTVETIDAKQATETLHILLKYKTDIAKAAKELSVESPK